MKKTGRDRKRKATARKRTGPRGVEYRRVYSVGGSLAVTLAPACLRLLGVEHGGTVQVMPHPSGKVIIAPMRMRLGAQHELAQAAREVIHLQKVVARLRKRLVMVPQRAVASGFSVGYAKAWGAAMLDLNAKVDRLGGLVADLVDAWKSQQPAPPTEGDAREQIEAAAARSGPGIGFALPPGVVAVDVPEPD